MEASNISHMQAESIKEKNSTLTEVVYMQSLSKTIPCFHGARVIDPPPHGPTRGIYISIQSPLIHHFLNSNTNLL